LTERSPGRLIAGAAAGGLCWLIIFLQPPYLPHPVTFYITAFAFVFGCGAIAMWPFERSLPGAERTALALGAGLAIAPLLICVFALAHAGVLFAPLAFALSGIAIARWYGAPSLRSAARGETRWYVLLPLLVFAATAWVSAGRMTEAPGRVAIFGDYDTLDLTYYASIGAALDHTDIIPPLSPFYAEHRIIYSYFPLLLLAAVQKTTGAGLLRAFLWYGWPFFGAVAAGALFAFFRRLGSVPFAIVSTVLVFSGSGFAYLAAWLSPPSVSLDPLIWSSVFLAPSAEWLFFNPWAPSLSLVATGLYALTRLDEPQRRWWLLLASLCFGLLFMFKSFAFGIVVPAIGAAALVALLRGDRAWRALAMAAIGAVVWALPWLLAILPFNRAENRGAVLSIEWLSLVRRMLLKTQWAPALEASVHRFLGSDPNYHWLLTIATVIFLVGALGTRGLGIVPLVRAAVGSTAMRRWTPLAWIVLLGIAVPFAVAVAPLPNSIQTQMFGLFGLWPFAVSVIWPREARPSAGRVVATAALIALSIPATAHYARAAHGAARGTPLMTMTDGDLQVIRALRKTNPKTTLVLNSGPLYPSLHAIEAERRVVLALSSYVSGDFNPDVDALSAQIEAFFGSPGTTGADDTGLLRRYHVTHVIERPATDRLHPNVVRQLKLISGTADVHLYEVPLPLRR
jgi:hypothetical protein